jgi:hypothetical protein
MKRERKGQTTVIEATCRLVRVISRNPQRGTSQVIVEPLDGGAPRTCHLVGNRMLVARRGNESIVAPVEGMS